MFWRDLLNDESGSPMLEEGLLIGLAIVVFLTIIAVVTGVLDWLQNMGEQLPGVINIAY
ncbi:MAG: Flp family type IVb pilin [Candidatus Njordarchaeia archaeon]